jgi:hypothetical protein
MASINTETRRGRNKCSVQKLVSKSDVFKMWWCLSLFQCYILLAKWYVFHSVRIEIVSFVMDFIPHCCHNRLLCFPNFGFQENLLTSWGTSSLSRRTLFFTVGGLVIFCMRFGSWCVFGKIPKKQAVQAI